MISEFLLREASAVSLHLVAKRCWSVRSAEIYCKPVTYLWGFLLDNAGKLGVSLNKAALLKHSLLPQPSILAKYLFLGLVSLGKPLKICSQPKTPLRLAVCPILGTQNVFTFLQHQLHFLLVHAVTTLAPIGQKLLFSPHEAKRCHPASKFW